ncbi:TIGR00255 family protein [Neorhodopirellula lusitana]|uniref:TIGR00255 family protein n=1 Tax=Neorhodopirellula lusitana TaxID=445327 RepID=A0ABY1PYD5_9BACT|nr:YicC/YloC family endoribonuclease [Neorhodopirellula lusitana]SMP52948.1 TIGR00255 family protein [Neorhodopirellula lusitana]
MSQPYSHLRSMTGQGSCEVRGDAGVLVVELRAVNHRGLKVVMRTNEALSAHESLIQKLVSGSVERGTVTVHASLKPPAGLDLPQINQAIALAYATQLGEVAHQYVDLPVSRATAPPQLELTNLLNLPGVMNSTETASGDLSPAEQEQQAAAEKAKEQLIRDGVTEAVARFNEMRHHEAVSMASVLMADLDTVAKRCAAIEVLAPTVVARYRDRLLDRIEKTLAEHSIETDKVDVIREVQLFADRSDISEEITRLGSHLELFKSVLDGSHTSDRENSDKAFTTEAVGRKLDFIIQEMFRETNTIGSKAGNAEIAEHIVEIKCAIERMRELVQNLE